MGGASPVGFGGGGEGGLFVVVPAEAGEKL